MTATRWCQPPSLFRMHKAGSGIVVNDAAGIAALVERLQVLQPNLIVLEATRGYQRGVVAALAAAQLLVAVVNPRQARGFAKATG
jgi:transposase